jgi:hypothetical protein
MLSSFVLLFSFIEHHQAELGESGGIGEDVDLDDPPVGDREGLGIPSGVALNPSTLTSMRVRISMLRSLP